MKSHLQGRSLESPRLPVKLFPQYHSNIPVTLEQSIHKDYIVKPMQNSKELLCSTILRRGKQTFMQFINNSNNIDIIHSSHDNCFVVINFSMRISSLNSGANRLDCYRINAKTCIYSAVYVNLTWL